jgi:hypothetical protein
LTAVAVEPSTKVGHISVAKKSVSWAVFISGRRLLYDSVMVVTAKVARSLAIKLS